MVKRSLENAEIEACIKDGIIGTNYLWYTAAGGADAICVFLSGEEFEKQCKCVKIFKKIVAFFYINNFVRKYLNVDFSICSKTSNY